MAGGFVRNNLTFVNPVRAYSNLPAQNLTNFINSNSRDIVSRQLRIATGRRTLRVEDGAAFYAISKKAEAQIRAKEMAIDNIGDAKDALSLAEAGLLRIDELLGHMRDIIVRAGNDVLTSEQRADVKRELEQLAMAIDDIAKRTRFNETDVMLNGDFVQTYQVGPNEFNVDKLTVKLGDFSAEALGINPDQISVEDNDKAGLSITALDLAIGSVKDQLMRLGGIQSELTGLENVLSGSIPIEQSVKSLYGDADLAREQVELTKLNLFSQLATAQAAAANAQPLGILSALLGG